MTGTRPHRLSAGELRAAFAAGTLTPSEATADVLRQIEALEPQVNSFARVTAGLAREQAEAAGSGRDDGAGPLHGCPVTIKDLIETAGVETAFGSLAHAGHVPERDAAVARRLRRAGAVFLGKTTTPEFGWKCPTDSPAQGVTRNPWSLERTPGGSSGGSAVAVACGMGPIGVGSDGGGSIRQPASFCGVVGYKPSFGRIPSEPPSGTIDTFNATGILARRTADVAAALDTLAGADERDWHSLPGPDASYAAALDAGIGGARVAWSPRLGYAAVEPEVSEIVAAAVRRFENELGCVVEEVDPGWPDPWEWFETLCMRMMAVGLRGYLERWRDAMDPALVDFIEGRGAISAEDLADAAAERIALQSCSRRFFERFDLLLTPTMAVLPFQTGIVRPARIAGRSVQGMQWTPFTYPFNITGSPAASAPAGWSRDGLPVGLQLVGGWRDDAVVLRACAAFEAISDWPERWPGLLDSTPT